jgi:hypothetical protein
MITDGAQRWRDRRGIYRPAGEVIRTADFEVGEFADDTTPRRFVEQHHYSASYPAARFRFGLYRRGELAGVAVFSHPVNDRVLSVFPGEPVESVELGRFVLLDQVAGNGETWFLARCFDVLRRDGLVGVLSFSDPTPRSTADGRVVHVGHIGNIYQAHNARYWGRGRARILKLLPDGTVLNERTIAKIRRRDRGYRPAVAMLERLGAPPLADGEDATAWLERQLAAFTRPLRHPGNHKYGWALDRRARRHLPASQPYPKLALVK